MSPAPVSAPVSTHVSAPVSAPVSTFVSAPVSAPVSTFVSAPVTFVARVRIDGKWYLRAFNNVLYDAETGDEVGIWDPETRTISHRPDYDDDDDDSDYHDDDESDDDEDDDEQGIFPVEEKPENRKVSFRHLI